MKDKQETKAILAIGEQVCNIIRIAYPSYKDITVEFDPMAEVLIFSVDNKTYTVFVVYDSVQAVVVDIAKQLLSNFIHNHN